MKTKSLQTNINSKPTDLYRWLALGSIAGPVIMTLAWIILGLIRPAIKTEWGISGGVIGMITQPFSGLGIGINGELFNIAFILNGLLTIAGVIGIFQVIDASKKEKLHPISMLLLASSGVGSMLCGIFTLESFLMHMLGFILACAAPAFGFLTTGLLLKKTQTWTKIGSLLIYACPLTLVLLVIFFITFQYDLMAAGKGFAGLSERVLVLEVMFWYAALGWLALRQTYSNAKSSLLGTALR